MPDKSNTELSPFAPAGSKGSADKLETILGQNEKPAGTEKSSLLRANLAEEDKGSTSLSEKPPLEAIITNGSPLGSKPEITTYNPPSGTIPTK